jgi:hypothetical protein
LAPLITESTRNQLSITGIVLHCLLHEFSFFLQQDQSLRFVFISYASWHDVPIQYESYTLKMVFEVRLRPGSYKVRPERVGATERRELIDPNIDNTELEWYTREGSAHFFSGILLKIEQL